jgi:hypothetical protein
VTVTADSHLRRAAGSLLLVVGTAAALFALTAPGGSSAGGPRTIDLGAGARTFDVDLASAQVRVSGGSGDRAMLRVAGDARIDHALAGGIARIRCAPGADCSGVHVELRLPRSAGLRARLGAGSASVSGLGGAIDLRSTGAALSVLDAKPDTLRAQTVSGAIHISLARVASLVDARSTSGAISVTVPYAYRSDGYLVRTRTRGHLDLDITAVKGRRAPQVRAASDTGDILITQRYPNMS